MSMPASFRLSNLKLHFSVLSAILPPSMDKPANYLKTKSHYEILDGLRGVAAIFVVAFHVFETYSNEDVTKQIINHGYLAVDFFFLLSGFVVSYAYDDRWDKMSTWDFFKRRLVRLQPMVIMGSIIGAAFFYFQASPTVFPLISKTPVWEMLLVMLIGCTLVPVTPSMDIRGWQEMHPLNGPAWSLFFEYIANILYALVFRRFSKTLLAIFVVLAACMLIQYEVMGPRGDVIGGWSINPAQLYIGFTRLLFPFFGGVLLCRLGKLIRVKNAFMVCSLLLIVIMCIPRIGGYEHLWMNGIYESVCIILLFPLIVVIGAGSEIKSKTGIKVCKFLGDISYPIYITHYALIYTYTAWVADNKIPMGYGLVVGLFLLIASVAMAWACLKWYDEPVREWLKRHFLMRRG